MRLRSLFRILTVVNVCGSTDLYEQGNTWEQKSKNSLPLFATAMGASSIGMPLQRQTRKKGNITETIFMIFEYSS